MDLREAKTKLLKDSKRRKAYEKVDLAYEIGKMITDARIASNHMTQQRLASLVGTKQPSIARLEKGRTLPSLSFLQKIADAFDTQLLPPRLQFLLEDNRSTFTNNKKVSLTEDYIEIFAHTSVDKPDKVWAFENITQGAQYGTS